MAAFAQSSTGGPAWEMRDPQAEVPVASGSTSRVSNNSPRRLKMNGARRGGGLAARAIRGAITQDEDVKMTPGAERKVRSSTSRAAAFGGPPPPLPDEKKPYGRPSDARLSNKLSRKRLASHGGSEGEGLSSASLDDLRAMLGRRFNSDTKLLDLENLRSDVLFTGHTQLAPPSIKNHKSSATARAMWKLVGAHFSHVRDVFHNFSPDSADCLPWSRTVSISLADNELVDLNAIVPPALLAALPGLQNLSLKQNKIAEIKVLNPLTSNAARRGLDALQELVLEGNPLIDIATKHDRLAKVHSAIHTRFPSLKALDGHILGPLPDQGANAASARPAVGSALRQPAAFPKGVAPGFFGEPESRDVATAFLTKFLSLYDSDRQAALAAYSPDATFSLSVTSAIPHRSRASKAVQDLPRQHTLDWKPYWDRSHNLIKSHKTTSEQHQNQIESTLATGPLAIASIFSKLPNTSHPLDDPSLFVVDAWTQSLADNAMLFVSLHGQYAEGSGKGLRSFDRNFMLAPPVPGSSTASEGWPCVIVSDQLLVRGYSEPKAWAEGSLSVKQQQLSSQTQAQPAAPDLSPEQNNLVLQLQAVTKLNTHFSAQCLAESGWNFETALANFQKVAASIPPEAFM